MKYYFKKELKKEALKGRSIKYMAEQIGYSKEHLYMLLNNDYGCTEKLALLITNFFDDSKKVEYYFEKK